MVEAKLQQAQFFLDTRRLDEAEKIILEALSEEPNHAQALAMLALVRLESQRYAEALEPAKQAVAAEPANPGMLYVLAFAHFVNNNPTEARALTNSALQLDPGDPELYQMLARISFHEQKWEEALYYCDLGLQQDSEHNGLVNLRAMCLVKLNRKAEAGHTIDFALGKDPENSYSHANKGWVQIEAGQYNEALESFKEALRIDPENDFARSGLKEAIRAKNPLYNIVLRYFLWMGKLTERNQWLVVIGAYVAIRIVRGLANSNPEWQPFLMPIIVAYIIFAFSSWIARPVANLFLRLHPLGKHALSADEKQGSSLAGITLSLALLCWLLGYFLSNEFLILAGGVLSGLLVPIGGMYSSEPDGKARVQLRWFAIVLALAGIGLPLLSILSGNNVFFMMGLVIFGIGLFAYSFIANYIISRESRRF